MAEKLLWKSMQDVKPNREFKYIELPSPYPTQMPGVFEARIRKMFTAEWLAFLSARTDDKGEPIKERYERNGELQVEFCWVDDSGKRQMADGDTKTEWWAKSSPAFAMAFISDVVAFNREGMIDVETARKNLPPAPGFSDTGGLPPTSESQTLPDSSTELDGASSSSGAQ